MALSDEIGLGAAMALDRRRFVSLAALSAVAAMVQACGSDGSSAAEVGDVRDDDGARVRAPAGQAGGAVQSVNGFGTSLYRRLAAADPTGNLVISPAGIALTMTMAMAGARGPTLDEMISTLDIDDPATSHRSMNALTTALDPSTGTTARLSLDTSLWGQRGTNFQAGYLDLLTAEYGAGVQLVDFAGDGEAARLAINGWVEARTEQRVPQLIASDVLDELTRLVLVNAVHVQAEWAQPFLPEATSAATFTTADGRSVEVPFIAQTAALAYATGDGWRAVELAYAGGALALLIYVPEDGFLELFESIFLVTDAIDYLQPQRVALRLPIFDIAASFSLRDQLEGMGMTTAFSDQADFGGMTTDEVLRISAVVHQATMTVDEQGTVDDQGTGVPAADAVGGDGSGPAPDDAIELTIDRPFVFALRNLQTGAIVLMGRVGDPAA